MTEPAAILEPGSDKAPDAYRTISEVAHELSLPQHVLRFWESRFGQIRPLKRGGGRRYYKPDDIALLKGIQHLLYNEGYTIKGVQKVLKTQGVRAVQMLGSDPAAIRKFQIPQDNETELEPEVSEQQDEPVLHIEAEELEFPETAAAAEQKDEQDELANQMSLFNGNSAATEEAIVQNKQQMAEMAKRLRSLRDDLHDIRAQLKKSDN